MIGVKTMVDEKDIEELLEDNFSYNNSKDEEINLLEKAYMIGEFAHMGQTRDDGSPYFEHPKRVAEIVSKYNKSISAKTIALLHDTLEDTKISYDYLNKYFSGIADEVLVLTKKDGEDLKIYLEKVFEYKSPNTSFVKIADRIDNIRDLKNCPDKNKVKRYIRQTEEIFLPIIKNHRYMEKNTSFQNIVNDLISEVEYAKEFI